MIELDVEARPAKPRVTTETAVRYLVLGDFGGRSTEPLQVDRDNIDLVLARLEVNLSGMRVREVEDFHPDRIYRRLDSFQDSASAEPEGERQRASPQPNLEEILRPSGVLEQMIEGGDPFQ